MKSRSHRSYSRAHHQTTQKNSRHHGWFVFIDRPLSCGGRRRNPHLLLTVNLPLATGLSPVTLQFLKQHIAMRHCSRIMSPVASSTFCKCLVFCNQCDIFNWCNWKSAFTFWCYKSPNRSYRHTAVKNTLHYSIRGHAIMEAPHSRQYPNILPTCKYPKGLCKYSK